VTSHHHGALASPAAALQMARVVGVLAIAKRCRAGVSVDEFDQALDLPQSLLPFLKIATTAARRRAAHPRGAGDHGRGCHLPSRVRLHRRQQLQMARVWWACSRSRSGAGRVFRWVNSTKRSTSRRAGCPS
jgi:hypothetical protein